MPKRCSQDLRNCTNMRKAFFRIFQFYHAVDNYYLREFKEKRFIIK